MANLNAMLEYQNVDMELKKIEDEIERSEYARLTREAQTAFKEAKEIGASCNKEAEVLINYYNKAQGYYRENSKRIEELSQKLKDSAITDIDKLKQQLLSLNETLANIERDLQDVQRKAEAVTQSYIQASKRGGAARNEFRDNKSKLDELKAQRQPEIEALRVKLNKLEKDVDAAFLEKYKSLRRDKVKKPFVTLEPPNKCGGCRVEMAIDAVGRLKQNGFIACESCGRIIYVTK